MSNKKTSDELSGSPIEGADLFRIARGTDNYKLTSDEIFSETLTKLAATNKMAANELIVGRVYKITTPSTAFPAISSVYLTAIATNKFSPEATVIMVDSKAYEAYYDFALDTFGYVNVTHAVLRDLGMNKQLVPGITYRITDYKSVNLVNGYNNFYDWGQISLLQYNNQETYVSPVEVLRIKAISDSQFELTASSESFPQDILEYDLYGNSACQYLEIFNGKTLPNSSTVSNFDLQWDPVNSQVYIDMPTGYPVEFNHYLYIYWDAGSSWKNLEYHPYYPNLSTLTTYDSSDVPTFPTIKIVNNGTRIVFEGLTYTDYNNYDTDTLYIEHVYKFADSYGHVLRRVDTRANIDLPLDFRNYKYRRYLADLYKDADLITPVLLQADIYVHANNNSVPIQQLYFGYSNSNRLDYDFSTSKLCSIFDYGQNSVYENIVYKGYVTLDIPGRLYTLDNIVFINSNCKNIFITTNSDYLDNLNSTFYEVEVYNSTFFSSGTSLYLFCSIKNTEFKTSFYMSLVYDSLIEDSKLNHVMSSTIYNNVYNTQLGIEAYSSYVKIVSPVINLSAPAPLSYGQIFSAGTIMGSNTTKNIFIADNLGYYVSYFNAAGPAMVYSTTIDC